MKIKLLILITLLATTGYYYLSQHPEVTKKLEGKVHQVLPELNQGTLYKWQNSKGEWQVTDVPPPQGTSFTTIKTQDQVNVMPGMPAKDKTKH